MELLVFLNNAIPNAADIGLIILLTILVCEATKESMDKKTIKTISSKNLTKIIDSSFLSNLLERSSLPSIEIIR